MAKYSYTDYQSVALNCEFTIRDLADAREALIETGPHSNYSSKHKLVLDIGRMLTEANERMRSSAENTLEYDNLSVVEYPTKKESAA